MSLPLATIRSSTVTTHAKGQVTQLEWSPETSVPQTGFASSSSDCPQGKRLWKTPWKTLWKARPTCVMCSGFGKM